MNQVKRFFVAAVLAAAAGMGCGLGSGAPQDDHEQVGRDVAESIVETTGAAKTLTALVAPMFDDTSGSAVTSTRLQKILSEQLVSAGCVTVSWSKLTATVDFDACELLSTGEPLDGAMTVVVRPLKLEVALTVDELTVGKYSVYGAMTAKLKGLYGGIKVGVDADLSVVDPPMTLVADGLDVVLAKDGMTVSGEGAVITDKVDATTTLDAVHWKLVECLPSSGSVAFVEGKVSGTFTFLETTPETGELELTVPPFDPTTITLPFSCP